MTCNTSPAYVTLTNASPATGTFSCTLTATVTSEAPHHSPKAPWGVRPFVGRPLLLIAVMLLVALLCQSRWQRRWEYWTLASALLFVGVWAACGGGAGGGGGGGTTTVGPPAVSLSSTALTFPQEGVAATSPPQSLTVSNTGNSLLAISHIAMGGTNPSDFAETNNCATVSPTSHCTINATFTPTGPGSRSGSLVLTDNAGDSPQSVDLTGTGSPGPVASFSPPSLTFGLKAVGSTSAPQIVNSFQHWQRSADIIKYYRHR